MSFGNAWTRTLFDGDVHRLAGPASPELPAVSLVVTQVDDPAIPAAAAGSPPDPFGATVPHLPHEGLTRVSVVPASRSTCGWR